MLQLTKGKPFLLTLNMKLNNSSALIGAKPVEQIE